MSGSMGKGFRGRRIEWSYFRFDNIQDGADGHLGMTALSGVTLASAGLSCLLCVVYAMFETVCLLVLW